MLNFIQHLTSDDYVIGIWYYDIAPYNIQMFYTVNNYFLFIDYLVYYLLFYSKLNLHLPILSSLKICCLINDTLNYEFMLKYLMN